MSKTLDVHGRSIRSSAGGIVRPGRPSVVGGWCFRARTGNSGIFTKWRSLFGIAQPEELVREMHEQWMSEYGRVYKDDAEKEKRFKIFKAELEEIEAFNKLNRGWVMGLNCFSDMTNEEFQAACCGCI
ncbi:hypothetical protein Dimus_032821 [Dionaea muscipula]